MIESLQNIIFNGWKCGEGGTQYYVNKIYKKGTFM